MNIGKLKPLQFAVKLVSTDLMRGRKLGERGQKPFEIGWCAQFRCPQQPRNQFRRGGRHGQGQRVAEHPAGRAATKGRYNENAKVEPCFYLKSLEVETVSKKFYLHELWKAGGWPPGYPVWRGEGQFRREVLKERGVQQVEDVLRGLPGLWNYITNEWLRYAIPSNTEATRSRWPIHPVWQSLAAVAWEGDPGPLTRKHTPSGIPTDEYMKRAASGLLTTEMARKGDVDPDRAWLRLKELVLDYFKERGAMPGVSAEALMLDKVAEKGRRYHTMNNTGGPKSKRQEERDYWDSRDYERQSDGW